MKTFLIILLETKDNESQGNGNDITTIGQSANYSSKYTIHKPSTVSGTKKDEQKKRKRSLKCLDHHSKDVHSDHILHIQ